MKPRKNRYSSVSDVFSCGSMYWITVYYFILIYRTEGEKHRINSCPTMTRLNTFLISIWIRSRSFGTAILSHIIAQLFRNSVLVSFIVFAIPLMSIQCERLCNKNMVVMHIFIAAISTELIAAFISISVGVPVLWSTIEVSTKFDNEM